MIRKTLTYHTCSSTSSFSFLNYLSVNTNKQPSYINYYHLCIVSIEDNLIFSHAGISKVWWENLKLGEPTKENLLKINELEPSELFAFTPSSMSDYCGDSFTQPCTWIRPTSLAMNHIEGWDQVVGHTRVRKPGNVMPDLEFYRENWNITMKEFWCIDALPLQYMIIEDGVRTMRDVKDITDIDNIINNI